MQVIVSATHRTFRTNRCACCCVAGEDCTPGRPRARRQLPRVREGINYAGCFDPTLSIGYAVFLDSALDIGYAAYFEYDLVLEYADTGAWHPMTHTEFHLQLLCVTDNVPH